MGQGRFGMVFGASEAMYGLHHEEWNSTLHTTFGNVTRLISIFCFFFSDFFFRFSCFGHSFKFVGLSWLINHLASKIRFHDTYSDESSTRKCLPAWSQQHQHHRKPCHDRNTNFKMWLLSYATPSSLLLPMRIHTASVSVPLSFPDHLSSEEKSNDDEITRGMVHRYYDDCETLGSSIRVFNLLSQDRFTHRIVVRLPN